MYTIKNIFVLFLIATLTNAPYAADQHTKRAIDDLVYTTIADDKSLQLTPICIPISGTGAMIEDAYKRAHPLKPNYTIDISYRGQLVPPQDRYHFEYLGFEDLYAHHRRKSRAHHYSHTKKE